MAARRLIMILIALLVVSSFAAALAPQESTDESTTSSTTTTTTSDPDGDGRQSILVEERIPAEVEDPPQVIELRAGDQLELVVEAPRPAPVRITGLGQDSFASPDAPARFDLLPRSPGNYAVTLDGGDAVARIDVSSR